MSRYKEELGGKRTNYNRTHRRIASDLFLFSVADPFLRHSGFSILHAMQKNMNLMQICIYMRFSRSSKVL